LKNIFAIIENKIQSCLFILTFHRYFFWGSNKISCCITDQKRTWRSKSWAWSI